MAVQKKFRFIAIAALVLVVGIAIYFYLFPPGPNLDPLPNPVNNYASKNWKMEEEKLVENPQKNLYWGDLHVHTTFSFDAYIGGNRETPSEAYEFAKGNPIELLGEEVQLVRPLDFAAVTDHAEFLGELYIVRTPEAKGHGAFMARYFRYIGLDTNRQREFFNRIAARAHAAERRHLGFFSGYQNVSSAWNQVIQAAEDHYIPGSFTTLAGYEWTQGTAGAHLHRNIIFRDMMLPAYPISSLEAKRPENLWKWMQEVQSQGSTLLGIPHNSNLSKGTTFPDTMSDGQPIDANYAQISHEFEPLVEIHQAKGNSEVHAALWDNDEFAGFENYTHGPPKPHGYVRDALKRGLKIEDELGTNPYKYGLIGSTDTHNSTPGNTEEDDKYIGNHVMVDMEPERRRIGRWVLDQSLKPYQAINPGGLVAVWAPQNTRGHIYDALQNKESYATSGTRIQLRFFGGFELPEAIDNYDHLVDQGYEFGVPMGGDIVMPSDKKMQKPVFYIWASRDPEGNPLDRVQMVKGWYQNGELKEKIYDIAASDGREPDAAGKVASLDFQLNPQTGASPQDKGAQSFLLHWTDPDFSPDQRCFYYLRVLEIKSARWTLLDKIRYSVEYPEDAVMTIQERAWSSPIWYSPTN